MKILNLITLLSIISIFACNDQQYYQSCTDASGNVVDESLCVNHSLGFQYYYTPTPFYFGSRAYGGSYISHTTHVTNVYHTTNIVSTAKSSNSPPIITQYTGTSSSVKPVPKSIISLHSRRK